MKRTPAFKFWALRESFWLITGITAAILLCVVALLLFRAVQVSQAIGAVATLVGFYIASLTLLHNQVMGSVDQFDRLNEKFIAPDMLALRARVASSDPTVDGPDDWEDLFDFFEEIAFKTRLGIIEAQVAYQMFSYWMLHYWFFYEQRLRRRRQETPEDTDLYSEFEWLVGLFATMTPGASEARETAAMALLRNVIVTRRAKFLEEERRHHNGPNAIEEP